MSIEQVKKEVWYYRGKMPTVQEAEEILDFAEENPSASLSEIVADYYGC
jgi:hypothetical protein